MPFSPKALLHIDRSAPRQTLAIRVIVALSLANLCYLRIWDLLLNQKERNYVAAVPYSAMDYFSAIVGVFFLTMTLYGIISYLQFHQNRWWRAAAMLAVLLIFLFPLDYVRRSAGATWLIKPGPARYAIVVGSGVVMMALAIRLRQRFYAILFWIVGVFSPLALFNFGRAAVAMFHLDEPAIQVNSVAPTVVFKPASRVVWIIFDEWDYAATFKHRPADLKLPTVDAIVQRSVTATQAFAPSNATRVSIPAMLTGQPVVEAVARGEDELNLRFRPGGAWVNFKECDHIIKDALSLGIRVVAAGWYHPYDRILPRSRLLEARSFGFPAYDGIRGDGLLGNVVAQYAYLTLPTYGRIRSRDLYKELHEHALKSVVNPEAGFVFLHYGIPHSPGIYDRVAGDFKTSMGDEVKEYHGNLALVDRTLAELLSALHQSGLREKTSLILTSDHWWRSAPWGSAGAGYPVPLIINVTAGGAAMTVDQPLLTTALRDVAMGILRGRFRDNASVAEYLAHRTVSQPIRYLRGQIIQ